MLIHGGGLRGEIENKNILPTEHCWNGNCDFKRNPTFRNMNESKTNYSLNADANHEIDQNLEILTAVVPIIVPVIFSLVIIIGFLGNILVVTVIILNKTMRTQPHNLLIFNLAVRQQ